MNSGRQTLPIDRIRFNLAAQVRAELKQWFVDDYATDIAGGEVLPPVVVFHELASDVYRLADGRQRTRAHLQAGRTAIEADVHRGGR